MAHGALALSQDAHLALPSTMLALLEPPRGGFGVGSGSFGRAGAERCLLPAGPWRAPGTDDHGITELFR